MKLKYLLPLIVLLAMVSAIYAKSGLFKKKVIIPTYSKIYISMGFPSHLGGVKAYDVFTGHYVEGKLNSDKLWELNLDSTHRYHIEVSYNSAQGTFRSINFMGTTQKINSLTGQHWYRITKESASFSTGSSYVLYSCQGINCFE